jgi:hypothetical protein
MKEREMEETVTENEGKNYLTKTINLKALFNRMQWIGIWKIDLTK